MRLQSHSLMAAFHVTAPIAGALLALWACALIGLPSWLAVLALFAGAGGYTAFVAWIEARYERLILLDLAVLETRFERITDLRAARLRSTPRVNAP